MLQYQLTVEVVAPVFSVYLYWDRVGNLKENAKGQDRNDRHFPIKLLTHIINLRDLIYSIIQTLFHGQNNHDVVRARLQQRMPKLCAWHRLNAWNAEVNIICSSLIGSLQ